MSRMVKHLISTSFFTIGVISPFLFSPASAQTAPTAASPAQNSQNPVIWKNGIGQATNVPASSIDPSKGNIPAALQRWKYLSESPNYSFSEYASFLLTYPDWPNSDDMRKNAEQAIDVASYSPSQAVAFFDRLEPVTNGGRAKYALALASVGDKTRAEQWGRRAWREGPLTDQDQASIQQMMAGKLTSEDYDHRVDRLLWANASRMAQALMPYTSAAKRPFLETRLAYMLKSPDAASRAAQLGKAGNSDAGVLLARAGALRAAGNSFQAREVLANRSTLTAPPTVAKDWLKALLSNAEAAANDGQYDIAYRIASKVDDVLPPGQKVSDQDLSIRDSYTSLVWLAGEAALLKLGRPRDAMIMFQRYSEGAKSPQTRSKGLYWAGRAAQKAGDAVLAQQYLTQAAQYYDFFHGQLALETLGQPLPVVAAGPPLPQLAINSNTLPPTFHAAKMAGSLPKWKDSNSFMRALSNQAKSEVDFLNLFSWSKTIARPDLSVIASRSARIAGHSSMIRSGYPTVTVPAGHESNWTMIHAIARQESQFDRNAVSHAGARGLMQLMPGTARETAGKIALSYRPDSLNSDVDYNIQLGSTYFQRMMDYYGGSYPLAVAAYNAGPGNVNKWLARNGDPRTGSIDILQWIEDIPIYETRNYVQRVLENAVMYDHLNPDKSCNRSATPLSTYLGRRTKS